MNGAQMLLAAPEFWVLVMACVIMIVDLFLSEERRGIIHMLAMLTVIFAAIITPPDIASQVIVAIPVLILYQVSILISKLVLRNQKRKEKNGE